MNTNVKLALAAVATALAISLSCGIQTKDQTLCDAHGVDCPGQASPSGPELTGNQEPPCIPTQINGGVKITCGSYPPVYVYNGGPGEVGSPGLPGSPGASGSPGQTGPTGQSGYSMVFAVIDASGVQCPTGGQIIEMAEDTNHNGVLDSNDSDFQTAVICNGAVGQPGVPGPSGQVGATGPTGSFTTASIIQPCGATSSPWKEVLLCLADGTILADFSDDSSGLNTRLSLIPPGSYIDTDESGCNFEVSPYGQNGLQVTWSAGSNQYSTWPAGADYCGA